MRLNLQQGRSGLGSRRKSWQQKALIGMKQQSCLQSLSNVPVVSHVMQQPAFVTPARLSLCSEPSSDSVSVGALESVSDVNAGCNRCVSVVFLASPARRAAGSHARTPRSPPRDKACGVAAWHLARSRGKREPREAKLGTVISPLSNRQKLR